MTSKGIKIPLELVELIDTLKAGDQPPGEVLLDVVKEYMRLREYAKRINKKDIGKSSVSDIIIGYYNDQDAKLDDMKESQTELIKMCEGLEIFFKKVRS